MQKVMILSTSRIIDNKGSHNFIYNTLNKIIRNGLTMISLTIDPLKAGWDTELEENHYRSGAAPIYALADAVDLISSQKYSVALINGSDLLKTGYKKDEKNELINIYKTVSIPEAYTKLTYEFMQTHQISEDQMKSFAEKLFNNYIKTAKNNNHSFEIDVNRFEFYTNLFRGVDCANPSIDFEGKILIGNEESAKIIGIPSEEKVNILGIGLGQTSGDGIEFIPEIAAYSHLKNAYTAACEKAQVDFTNLFLAKKALLEIYTCYPIVPIAFLLTTGLVKTGSDLDHFLDEYDITITGGMNLAKAPWNNSALNALILMYEKIKNGTVGIGCIHGNGGLGYKQGVAIIGKS